MLNLSLFEFRVFRKETYNDFEIKFGSFSPKIYFSMISLFSISLIKYRELTYM